MKVFGKTVNYYLIIAFVLLFLAALIGFIMQERQVVAKQNKGEAGKPELFARQIQRPQGLTRDKEDRIFAQCSYDGKISIINKDGKFFDYAYLDDFRGYGIEVDKKGHFVMAGGTEVVKVDSFGKVKERHKGFKNAYDVELAPDGTIFVSDSVTNTIYQILDEGEVSVFAALGGRKSSSIANAAGLRFDKQYKNLYVVNTYTGEMYKIEVLENFESGKVEVVASGLEKPNFIDIDVQGNAYITCLGDNSVVRVDQNSIVEVIDTGDKLSAPSGIVLSNDQNNSGTLYVASRDSNSIYKIYIGIKNRTKK